MKLVPSVRATAAVVVALAACTDSPTESPLVVPTFAIRGTAIDNGPHFAFLPPLVARAVPNGAFDGSLSPDVAICALEPGGCVEIVRFTSDGRGAAAVRVSDEDGHYLVNWHTADSPVRVGGVYRLRVLVAGTEVGTQDVVVTGTGKGRGVDNPDALPEVRMGTTVPIKFWVGAGAVYPVGPMGGTLTSPDGRVSLSVPAGALGDHLGITFEPVNDLPDGVGLIGGLVYDFQPDGTTFATPVAITLAYAESLLPSGLAESQLTIITEEHGVWSEVDGVVVDVDANTITGYISGFSKKAAASKVTGMGILGNGGMFSLAPGESRLLEAVVYDALGELVDRKVNWSSSDGAVATVDADGLVSATGAGTALITVSSGQVSYSVSATVSAPFVTGLLDAAGSSTCALAGGTDPYCWGWNSSGQLGDGSTSMRSTPVAVAGGHAFSTILLGGSHTCAVDGDGSAFCWGANSRGQLGDGTHVQQLAPTAVSVVGAFEQLELGGGATCAVDADGVASCWGSGPLGNGTATISDVPLPVAGGLTFASIGVGSSHACGVTTNGAVYCWGDNRYGQLGNGTTTNSSVPVAAASGGYASVSVGQDHTCAVTTGGGLTCWGRGDRGQLGTGSVSSLPQCTIQGWGYSYQVPCSNTPLRVSWWSYATVAAGRDHTCALTSTGAAYCWGQHSQGQIGHGGVFIWGQQASPRLVVGNHTFRSLTVGADHSCGLSSGDEVLCWGRNSEGQLGDGTTTNRATPVAALVPSN